MRKKYKIILVTACVLILISTAFFTNTITKKERDEMLKQYLEIAGGWYMNEKCDYLSEQLKKEFENDTANITIKLNKVVKIEANALLQIQKGAKETAYSGDYPCNKKSQDMIVITKEIARKLSNRLNRIF